MSERSQKLPRLNIPTTRKPLLPAQGTRNTLTIKQETLETNIYILGTTHTKTLEPNIYIPGIKKSLQLRTDGRGLS
jgi:hypothetical protein